MQFSLHRTLLLVFCLFAGFIYGLHSAIPEDEAGLAEQLEAECQRLYDHYGVNIFWEFDELNFFDFGQLYGPRGAKATQVSLQAALANIQTLENFFQSYSPEVLWQNIKSIYLLGSLYLGQTQVGGLFLNQYKVYVVIPDSLPGVTQNYIFHVDGCLHHEFGHALFDKYASLFPIKDWIAANPEDFEYQGSALEVIDQGIASNSGTGYWEQGFLAGYCTANMGEDEAVLAEHYFTTYGSLMNLARNHPALARKVEMFEAFMDKVELAGY